jgi:DNA-directed RNA polymerase delta subunit
MATTLNGEARIILTKAKKPMTAKQIYKEIQKRGNLKLRTETPVASLNSELYKDMKRKGNQSIFTKIEKISNEGKLEKYYSIK